MHEERKVITALFCDLVGSTALGELLDAEDVSRLLRDYHQICRKTIESHGGGTWGRPRNGWPQPRRCGRRSRCSNEGELYSHRVDACSTSTGRAKGGDHPQTSSKDFDQLQAAPALAETDALLEETITLSS